MRGLLDQLDQVVAAPSELGLVTSTPHLRVLLLDSNPLYSQVRRERRAQGLPNPAPHFEILENSAYTAAVLADGPSFYAPMDGLSPRLSVGLPGRVRRLNTGEFLKHRAMYVEGRAIMVRDVIRQVAYVGGLVHAGTPKDELQILLADWDKRLRIGNLPAILSGLRSIIDVTTHALRPVLIE